MKSPESQPTSKVALAMEYGAKHEIDAIATLVVRAFPALYPDLVYVEEGCSASNEGECPFFLSSLGSSLRESPNGEPVYMYAFGCTRNNKPTKQHQKQPSIVLVSPRKR